MKKLLFLVHRLPFPPNKGDKISSSNMLKYFSRRWRVHLGTFIDDPDDWQYADHVRDMCEDSCILALPLRKRFFGSVEGLLSGQALSLPYYANAKLKSWVKQTVARERPDAVLVYSGAMAQFAVGVVPPEVPILFNAEDVDSEKWRSYADAKPWPLSWLYRREANKLLAFERSMAAQTSASVFISEEEANLFKRLAPESAAKVHHRTQGVDSEYFDPARTFDNPYLPEEKVLVFTGAMDYWPNIDAVTWFVEHVLEHLRQAEPQAVFYIVGMRPVPKVQRLEKHEGVRVTGAVADVRPYLAHALAACLPLQIARGIQNKALEAMSMALPVLATTQALTGISAPHGTLNRVADSPEDMQQGALELLSAPRQMNAVGRDCVLDQFSWESNLQKLEKLLVGSKEAV